MRFSRGETAIFLRYLFFLILVLDFFYLLGLFTAVLAGFRRVFFLWFFIAWFVCVFLLPEISRMLGLTALGTIGKLSSKEKGVVIVSVDGGCAGIKDVGAGVITATSQQYPLKMAAMGVDAGIEYAKTGKKVSGYTDTGVTLITDQAQDGVDSEDSAFGLANCWGTK